jgi:hypothetical protein
MKQDILKKYTTLRNQLERERAELRARLTGIEAALGGEIPIPLPTVKAEAPVRRKRKMSPAGRAAVKAAAKARWAAYRAQKAGNKGAPQSVRKPKKRVSAAARAKLAAAAKARWAKAKAAGKTRL